MLNVTEYFRGLSVVGRELPAGTPTATAAKNVGELPDAHHRDNTAGKAFCLFELNNQPIVETDMRLLHESNIVGAVDVVEMLVRGN